MAIQRARNQTERQLARLRGEANMKVECEGCNGKGVEEVKEYQTGRVAKIACRACEGQGYYEYDELP